MKTCQLYLRWGVEAATVAVSGGFLAWYVWAKITSASVLALLG